MKFCLLCFVQGGVVVSEAGSDPSKARDLLLQCERDYPDKAWQLAVLHGKPPPKKK